MGDFNEETLRERFARALCKSDAEDWRRYLGKADLILEVLLDPTRIHGGCRGRHGSATWIERRKETAEP